MRILSSKFIFWGTFLHWRLVFFTEDSCKIFSGTLFYKFTATLYWSAPSHFIGPEAFWGFEDFFEDFVLKVVFFFSSFHTAVSRYLAIYYGGRKPAVFRPSQKGVTKKLFGWQKGVQKKVSPPFWKNSQMCGGYALAWDIFLDCCSFFIQILDPWKVKECIWDSNKGSSIKRCPSRLTLLFVWA